MKKNILIVASSGLGKTGVPNVIFQVVSVLSNIYSVDVAVFNDDNFYTNKIIAMGCKVIRINLKEPKNKVERLIYHAVKERNIIREAFGKLFKTKKYFCIHSFREHESAYIFELAAEFGIEHRIIHCNNEVQRPKNLISFFIFNHKMKKIYKYTTKLIGVSNECCKKTYPGMHYVVLFNSYDETKYNMFSYNLNKSSKIVIAEIGTFSSRKNQLFLLKSFAKIVKEYPNSRLYLVGTEVESGYLLKIQEYIKRQSLENNVIIFDGLKDFSHILKKTLFVALPSIHEAAPIVLIESQACGIACFASNTITKDVDCGGVTYLPLDEKVWAQCIINEYNNKRSFRNKYDVSAFSSKTFRNNLIGIYKEITEL